MEYVPIVDEEGNVIGKETRKDAHLKGLRHPVVRVLIKLPNNKFVFQRRSLLKEINPGLITYSVGGHVQAGQTTDEAAVMELKEETGIEASIEQLVFLGKGKNIGEENIEPAWGQPHRVVAYFYGLRYEGTLESMKIEAGDGDGFVAYSVAEINALSPEKKAEFVSIIFRPEVWEFFEKFDTM